MTDKLEKELKSEQSSLAKESRNDLLDLILCAEFHKKEKGLVRVKKLVNMMNVILARTNDAKMTELCRNMKRAAESNRNRSFLKCVRVLDAGYSVDHLGKDRADFKELAGKPV